MPKKSSTNKPKKKHLPKKMEKKDKEEKEQKTEWKMVTKPTTYTREFVLKELEWMLAELEVDESIVFKKELINPKPYSSQRYSEWANDFAEDSQISETIKKIDDILETRLVKWWLTNVYNSQITRLCLTANYNRENRETITHKIEWDSESKAKEKIQNLSSKSKCNE